MKMMRAALVGILAVLVATAASAQPQGGSGVTSGFTGQALGVGPGRAQHATPLFMLGGVGFGIWTRVPAPYDVSANRNAAANPLP